MHNQSDKHELGEKIKKLMKKGKGKGDPISLALQMLRKGK